MNTIIIFIIGIVIVGIGIYSLNRYFDSCTNKQKQIILHYLTYAVVAAEQLYGSKTGQLKLARVYNDFLVDLPMLAKYISYEDFTKLVDIALIKMNEMLKNKAIEAVIK